MTTLTQHFLNDAGFSASDAGDLTIMCTALQEASKVVSSKLRRAGILNLFGLAGTQNVHDEDVKKIDMVANDAFLQALNRSGKIAVVASEENDDIVLMDNATNAEYVLAMDPLDGSSNIDAGISVGSIIAVWRRKSAKGEAATSADLLQPGRDCVFTAYVLYSVATVFVVATPSGVNGFTLDETIGEYKLSHRDIKLPTKHSIYSVNEGNYSKWDDAVKKYVDSVKFPTGEGAKAYSLRYIGSMVSDVHRTLLYGGIFMYPADKKSPNGKLRILYEGIPMSFICEKAGGSSSTGTQRLLDIIPQSLHERKPILLGSTKNVEEACAFFSS